MRRRRQLHRVTIGRTREVRGPDAMERAAVGLVIFVVMTIAIGFGVRQVHMVQSLDAVLLASGPYYDEIVYRSVYGAWPSTDRGMVGGPVAGHYARNVTLDPGGGITARLMLDARPFAGRVPTATAPGKASGLLSFRPEQLGTRDFPAFTLLCGYAKPMATDRVDAADRTTLDRKDLPPFCR